MVNSVNPLRGRRGLLAVAAIGLAAAVLVGCANAEPGPGSGEPAATGDPHGELETTKLTVSTYRTNAPSAALFAAVDDGIAEKWGLDLEVVFQESGSDGLALLQSGDAQIIALSLFPVVTSNLSDIPLRIVTEQTATTPGTQQLVVMPDSPIKDVADLEGKTVGILTPGSLEEMFMRQAVAEAGVDPSTVKVVQVPWADAGAALELGNIDAAAIYGSALLAAKDALDLRVVFDYGDPSRPSAGWITNEAFAKENPNTVQAFTCALREATHALVDDDDLYVDVVANNLGMTREEVIALGQTVEWLFELRPAEVQSVGDAMVAAGAIPEEFDMSSVTIPQGKC